MSASTRLEARGLGGFHGAQKSLQRYPGGHFYLGNGALMPPPYQPAPAGDLGDRGDLGFGSWNLGSGDHPGRAIWESNLGRGSWNLGAGEHPGRAIWESNLGRAIWGVVHIFASGGVHVHTTTDTHFPPLR